MTILEVHVDAGESAAAPIAEGLRRYNETRIGRQTRTELVVTAADDRGRCVGGVQGILYWGWLYIERMWVDEERRGSGLGSVLLDRIEAEASQRNVTRIALLTASWQAPDFYRSRGYEQAAAFDLDIAGVEQDGLTDYLMVKRTDHGAEWPPA
jgi:GNAT superfamily N-acetyltransferase